ncbi:MAG TPA: nucleotide modification associated domain-containing protein, partial [Flavobacteriales bacterium]|nr:nucleotide modification associated domain-containing protein [Flavobacteriales bacterium]
MDKTLAQYDAVTDECLALFAKKAHDYGTAWRILRVSSLTDQI